MTDISNTSRIKIRSAGNTDTGLSRKNNEDAFLLDDGIALYAVADGIGGHAGGEVASRMAVEMLREGMAAEIVRLGGASAPPPANAAILSSMTAAIERANRSIMEAGARDPGLSGMGTTLTAMLVSNGIALIAHIGDSRAYLLRDGILRQVTDDHGVVAEQVRAGLITPDQAKRSPYRHIITRALGIDWDIRVDRRALDLRQDDVILLCTDGLTEMVEDPEIERILAKNDPGHAVTKLITAANGHGGVDNITVVVIKTDGLR